MPILIPYLVKLFISLGIVFFFYQLVLRKITFYNANRWYLVGFTLLSFIVPLINVTPVVQQNETAGTLAQLIPSVQSYSIGLEEATHCPMPLWSTSWNKWDWLLLLFACGALFFLIRFAVRCFSFLHLRRHAQLISSGDYSIYHVDAAIIPFSFGNSIFINSSQHTETELREIIRHEFIHVKQRHTADILWAELLCMLNWYNPAAWYLKKAIRQNLEFIADHKVLENGVDKKQYQYLLLKVIGNDQFSIAQKFNFSSLKKRIAMMNKTRSARTNLLRFLFVLPVLAIILISFRDQLGNFASAQEPVYTDTIPDPPKPNSKGYLISIKDNNGQCMVVVKSKDGKVVEKLALTKWNDSETMYEEKYGEIPPPPKLKTPKAPLPPTPPQPANPALPVQPTQPPQTPIPPRQEWNELITRSDDFEITDKKAVIHLKDGTTEEYDLTKPAERKKFESKWGRIIETSEASPVAILSHGNGTTVVGPISPVADGGFLVIDDNGPMITGKEDILITITKYTTREQLETYKKQMKEKGVELTYDEIEYNDKGVLVTLTGTMKANESRSNFVATDFQQLQLAMIKSDGRIYFKVRTSNDREVVKRVQPIAVAPSEAITARFPMPAKITAVAPIPVLVTSQQ